MRLQMHSKQQQQLVFSPLPVFVLPRASALLYPSNSLPETAKKIPWRFGCRTHRAILVDFLRVSIRESNMSTHQIVVDRVDFHALAGEQAGFAWRFIYLQV